jgi:hypothetical protein
VPIKLKKIAQIILIFGGLLILLILFVWFVVSFMLVRKISTSGRAALVVPIKVEAVMPGLQESVPGKPSVDASMELLSGKIESETLPEEFRDYQKVKKDSFKMGYLIFRSLSAAHDIRTKAQPELSRPLCETICDKPIFDEATFNKVGPLYMEDFFNEYRMKAFDDFHFRLYIESLDILHDVIGPDFVGLYQGLYASKNLGVFDEAAIAVKLNYYSGRLALRLKNTLNDVETFLNEMNMLGDLAKTCSEKNLTEIRENCEKILASPSRERLLRRVVSEDSM